MSAGPDAGRVPRPLAIDTRDRHLLYPIVRLPMRHRDVRTTCNLYRDLGMTDVQEAVLRLPSLWAA